MGIDGQAPNARAGQVKIFLIEEQPLVREALVHFLGREAGLKVSTWVSSGRQVLSLLEKALPNVVLMDLLVDGLDGLDLIKRILAKHPNLPILAFSMLDEEIYAERVFRAGAKGYLSKKAELPEILAALRTVARGGNYFSANVQERLWARIRSPVGRGSDDPMETLSDRELHVFHLIGKGISTRSIASRLRISIKTVETYRANIKEKLMLKNGTELVRHAVGWYQEKRV